MYKTLYSVFPPAALECVSCPEGCEVFNAPTHASSLLTSMREFRNQKNLCDITLCVEEQEFDAHRVVLAASSPYFNAMFSHEHRESKLSKVTLNGIDPSALKELIEFAYSATLTICEDNIQSLLTAANLLQVTSVIDACCKFLQDRIDTENCLGLISFADMHGFQNLYEKSWRYALDNFRKVTRCEEFLAAPTSLITSLIKSEQLSVKSEDEVLDCVLKWYKHDKLSRVDDLISILQHVKLPLIPWEVISEKILNEPSLAVNTNCQILVTKAKCYQSDTSIADELADTPEYAQYMPRKSIGQRRFIYVVGGETNPGRSTVCSVEGFNPSQNTWKTLAPMESCRRGVGVAVLDGMLYAVGGSDSIHALRLVERYDLRQNRWTRLEDMNQERSSVAAIALRGFLYAVGGYDGIMSCLSSVERYDPNINSWSYVCNMTIPRSMHAVEVYNDRLFVIGGYDGATDLSSCEVYDPETNTWTEIEEMHSKRCMPGVGMLGGLFYAVGGCDCSHSLSSVEAYDPEKKQWTLIAEMSEPRSGLGVAVVGQKLYALGGYCGSSSNYSDTVECYDPESDSWSQVANMIVGRRRFGCCS